MNVKTRAISEGAMLLALLAVFLFLNIQFASVFALLFFLLSIPYVIYSIKHGMRYGFIFAFSSLFIVLIVGDITSLFYLSSAIVIGLLYAYGMKRSYSYVSLLCMGSVANVMVTMIAVLLLGSLLGYDLLSEVKVVQTTMASLVHWDANLMYQIALISVVFSYLALACMQAFIVLQASLVLLQRLRVAQVQLKKAHFRLAKTVALLCMISGFVLWFAMQQSNSSLVYNIILFVFIASYGLCIVNGAIYALSRIPVKKRSQGIVFVLLLACFIPVLQTGIALLGIIDSLFSLRLKRKAGVIHEIHRKN